MTHFQYWLNKDEYPEATAPERKHEYDAGWDVKSAESYTIKSGEREIVHTGIHFKLQPGWEIQVRPRSGLAAKHGLTVLNSPGTIDAEYVGELMVIIYNSSSETYTINTGDRIAQLVFSKINQIYLQESDSKPQNTERGEKGFGSTGK